jgi:tRNA(Arg) A34 adenosine deaminase TadA
MFLQEKFMKAAIKLSLQKMKDRSGGPFGCVIVQNGKIIAKGWNQVTSKNDPTNHAEIVAIRNACKKIKTFQLTDCEMYTSCEPCPMCLGAIYWARPAKVYFANNKKDATKIGFDDSFIYEEILKDFKNRKIPFEQIMRKEALVAFEEWQKKEDKIKY